MPDDVDPDTPEDDEEDGDVAPAEDPDLFGIHLGHRDVRPDEVDPRDLEPPPQERRAPRSLSDRLASAAADRDDRDDRDDATNESNGADE